MLVQDNLGLDSSGWAISGAYGLELRFAPDDFNFLPPQQGDPDFGMGGPWIKFVFHTPDGGEAELRPMDYSGYAGFARTYLFGYFLDTANFLGQQGVTGVATRYYSFDGSYIYAIVYPAGSAKVWEVYMLDGTHIVQKAGGKQRIWDANNNQLEIQSDAPAGSVITTHYRDTMASGVLREFRHVYDSNANTGQVQYQTVNGNWVNVDIVWKYT